MKGRFLWAVGVIALFCAALAPLARAHTYASSEPQSVDWPETSAARFARGYFEAFNADSDDVLRQFIKQNLSEAALKEKPLDQRMGIHLGLRKMAGKLAVNSVSVEGDVVVIVIARAKLGWARFRITLSPEPPHYLAEFEVRPTSSPGTASPPDYSDWKDLRDLLEKVRRDAGAPGMAAAVVRGGKTVETAVTGLRRFDQPGQVQVDDRFHLGSVGKSFTATMIGVLVEDKILQWDTTINEVLGDIPMKEEYRGVTLEQLLQHRGGVPTMPETGEFAEGLPRVPGRSPAEARTAVVRQVLLESPVNPGEYSYSNAGYVVAAYMAERTTKQSWEELIRRLVFEPLKLQSAGFGWPATKDRPNQPYGHFGALPKMTVQAIGEDATGDLNYFGPAGNIHCSVEDCARFAALHLQGLRGQNGVLSAEVVRRLHAPPEGGDYASGWWVRQTGEAELVHEHTGSGGTFYTWIVLYPDSDLGIVLLTNCGFHAKPFLKALQDAIHERIRARRAT